MTIKYKNTYHSCMYTLYNDFKYKNTYLHVCIPYISIPSSYTLMTLNIRIHTFMYVYLI